jgi:hypothetical protein
LRGFLNQHWVQSALGVPVNYTASSQAVSGAFSDTSDFSRSDSLEQITYLLEKGVKVSLVYGDRDFACNWIAGERTSLAIEYSGSAEFRGAGYMPIITNSTYIGGQVRQYGNLSFSRVYQAGHEGTSFPQLEDPRNDTDRAKVPWYQPETAYELFMRALFNKDMATGLLPIRDDYQTVGPASTWHIKNEIPERPEPVCYILAPSTCTKEQYDTVINGTAIIENYIVVGATE